MQRREFLNKSLLSAGMISLSGGFNSCILSSCNARIAVIDNIELYRYDINTPRHFSWGTWFNRQHVFMKLSSGKHIAWSEIPVSKNNPDFNMQQWSRPLASYKNLTIDEAFKMLLSHQKNNSEYSGKMMEFIELALLDLLGRIEKKPSIELLNLDGNRAVPGLFCILQNDLDRVESQALSSLEANLGSHMKVKMFGDKVLDLKILKLVRDVLGPDAMIMSDANRGYKYQDSLAEVSKILNLFHDNGLFAIEDPALMSVPDWIALQSMVGELHLIPDHIMGPSWEGLQKIKAGMGRIYNIHPSRMGSIMHGMKLIEKIDSFGADLMIGDDSLVGPACTTWQQIAIGAGAVWVEAIEKLDDSDDFLSCVIDQATYRDDTGKFNMKKKPGFGLDMDEDKLNQITVNHIVI